MKSIGQSRRSFFSNNSSRISEGREEQRCICIFAYGWRLGVDIILLDGIGRVFITEL